MYVAGMAYDEHSINPTSKADKQALIPISKPDWPDYVFELSQWRLMSNMKILKSVHTNTLRLIGVLLW